MMSTWKRSFTFAACMILVVWALRRRSPELGRCAAVSIGKYEVAIGKPRRLWRPDHEQAQSRIHMQLRDKRLLATTTLGPPTNVRGVQLSSPGTIFLAWDAPTRINSTISIYEVVYQGVSQEVSSVQAVNVTGMPAPTSVNITGLTTGATYIFAVRAIEGNSSSSKSENSPEVVLAPGRISSSVSLSEVKAGASSALYLNFTCAHELPADGRIYVQMPASFVLTSDVMVTVSTGDSENPTLVAFVGLPISISRAGLGISTPAGTVIKLVVHNVTNPPFAGETDPFELKTTDHDGIVPIDEVSVQFNSEYRPEGVRITPGAFHDPMVRLERYSAGAEGAANLSFTTSNAVPSDGLVIIQFPDSFRVVKPSDVIVHGMDGNFLVWGSVDGYTVEIRRDGSGTRTESQQVVLVRLVDGVWNPQHEGASGVFPLLQTTTNETRTTIDEASTLYNSDKRPSGVAFTPGRFQRSPEVVLLLQKAGSEGGAAVAFTIANPLPVDGCIVIQFPAAFSSIDCRTAAAVGVDGGFDVSVDANEYEVVVQRDGSGTIAEAGTNVTLTLLDGIRNQAFEGASGVFPVVKTTLADGNTSVDEASPDFNVLDRPGGVWFSPGAFRSPVNVSLSNYTAGAACKVFITFVTSNPIPSDGNIIIEFPTSFAFANVSEVVAHGVDGKIVTSLGDDGYTVVLGRIDSGVDVASSSTVRLELGGGIINQPFEGYSGTFPVVKTTLADARFAIDEASLDENSGDRPVGLWFIPGNFREHPVVRLDTYTAGAEGGGSVTFLPSNPIPSDGHVIIGFPKNFSSVNCTTATASGMDGGLVVSVDAAGFVVHLRRDGTGSSVTNGATVEITFTNGIQNQAYAGTSDLFPFLKTTLGNESIAIDEVSCDVGIEKRPGAVTFTPASFAEAPKVALDSYVAGRGSTANITFVVSNPVPRDGHLIIEFPTLFWKVNATEAVAFGMDGNLSVSLGGDGYTVDIQRTGSGTEVARGDRVSIALIDGVVNSRFEGPSGTFPVLKTTMGDAEISIDEASDRYNEHDQPASVMFTPGRFLSPVVVNLNTYEAGAQSVVNVSFTIANPVPADGHVIVHFPSSFSSVNPKRVLLSGVDGQVDVDAHADAYVVDIARDGTGTAAEGGTDIIITVTGGIVNQMFEGPSDVFPTIKTTLSNTTISIDEISADYHSADRPLGVIFIPSRFRVRPSITLASYVAGHVGAAYINFTTSNAIPFDGHVIVEFPPSVYVLNCSVGKVVNLDGDFSVSVNADGHAVVIQRDGTGTATDAGEKVTVEILNGIQNQRYEGTSGAFPAVRTTTRDANVSIDEASMDYHDADRAPAIFFTPGAFALPPSIELESYEAGVEGGANTTLTIANPLPPDGHIFVEFPREFVSVTTTQASTSDLDGELSVSVSDDGYTLKIQRDGSGTTAVAGATLSLTLMDGIHNQLFSGSSAAFPSVKTTLSNTSVTIDESTLEHNVAYLPAAVWFTPGSFGSPPSIMLEQYIAGVDGAANITLTTSNPLPSDGHVMVEFPPTFASVRSTGAVASGVDGGFRVSRKSDGFTVDIERDGTGTLVPAGHNISIKLLGGIKNQNFEGASGDFPLIKTTLSNVTISIDEASSHYHMDLRPRGYRFTPGMFLRPPIVTLSSQAAGHMGGVNITFTNSNPLPSGGHVVIEFPANFLTISCTEARALGIDGELKVSVVPGGRTVDIQRYGGGSDSPSGTNVTITLLGGVRNQPFEGASDVFPVVKTTLANSSVSADEASADHHSSDRPATRFIPAAFAAGPTLELQSYAAGYQGSANISFTASNPIPIDGHVIVAFPSNFTAINCTNAVSFGIDGSSSVSAGDDAYTLDIEREGTGTVVPAGTSVRLVLTSGIKNQQFEGLSMPFVGVKTTTGDKNIVIDDSAEGPRLLTVPFVAATFPVVNATVRHDVAGMRTSISFTFIIANPLPPSSTLVLQLPADFSSAAPERAESQELGPLSVAGTYLLTIQRDGSGTWLPPGKAITVTLSSVVNRPSAGYTGNFSLTSFTDESKSNRIDVGFAMPIFIGKEILSASTAEGSSSVSVAGQEKSWLFTGPGVAAGDEVTWVNSSASSDDDCDWRSDTSVVDHNVNMTTSTAAVSFANSSEHTGPLRLCYRFSSGNHPFKLYATMTVDVYDVWKVSGAEEGSTAMSVAGYPKTLTFAGFGLTEGDKAQWVLGGAPNCTLDEYIVPLADGGADEKSYASVTSSLQAAFQFEATVFTSAKIHGNESLRITLCYKFGEEEFHWYPMISMHIHHIDGFTSDTGGASMAVATVAENLTFTGRGICDDRKSCTDRAKWISSGANCSVNAVDVLEAEDGLVDIWHGQGTFTFQTSASGETPRLCYWFQDEPAMVYPFLTIDIAFVSELLAPSFGDNDVAVAGMPKTWKFNGGHIRDGDLVRWVRNGSLNCSDENSGADMAEGGGIEFGQTECTFPTTLAGTWITPCYRHASEPWRRYELPVYIKMLTKMTSTSGNDSALVVDQPKQWTFHGHGLASTPSTDLVKLVAGATDCSDDSGVLLEDADIDDIAVFVSAQSTATFTIDDEGAGKIVYMCYKFGNEEYMWYDIRAYVHMLQGVESQVGGKDLAVVDVQEVFVLHGNGTCFGDFIRWVLVDVVSSDDACNNTLTAWASTDSTAREVADIPVYREHNTSLTNFTFDTTMAGMRLTLCYKFAEEPWKIYQGVTIDVAMLQAVNANEGSDTVAVVEFGKIWSFTGHFLAAGDEVFWSTSGCATSTAAKLVGDADGIVHIDDALASSFVFHSSASGKTLRVCYRFSDEPFKEYAKLALDVRMIRAVAVDVGSARKAMPGVAKTFFFVGDGTASEAGVDRVKWIEGNDCLVTGITGHAGGLAPETKFDLVYFDATGVTARTISFPEAGIGGPYALCYAFDEEPFQVYDDLILTVLGISEVRAQKGADDVIVVGAVKRLNFTGGGAVEAGDIATWVSGGRVDSDCLIDVFLTGPQGVVDASLGADFSIAAADGGSMAGQTWTLCYRFGSETFKIYPAFSLTAVTLDAFKAEVGSNDDSVVGYPKTFLPIGAGVSVGDHVKWVSTLAATDDECESMVAVAEGTVEWAITLTSIPGSAAGNSSSSSSSSSSIFDAASAATSSAGAADRHADEVVMPAVTIVFGSPTLGSVRLKLCYQHQAEPYHLHPDIDLQTRELISASVREVGVEQHLVAIVNSPQAVAFAAFGGMEGDRYKWVYPARHMTTNGSAYESPAIMSRVFSDVCGEAIEPGAGSSVGVSEGFHQEATFTFTEPASQLHLCYAPGAEPFMPYTEITMHVLSPMILRGSATHVLVGRDALVRLVGTFGLTAGDGVKLADNTAGDCSGSPAGGNASVFYPHATKTGLADPSLGTSDVIFHVNERTDESRPYKLCYRFGARGAWEMFDNVALDAFEITAVTTDTAGSSTGPRQLMDFTFWGTGIATGDQARWVNGSVTADSDCALSNPTSGSSISQVEGKVAQFSFTNDVEDWLLCYKHGSDNWRLYDGESIIPVSTSSATSTSPVAVSETQQIQAEVSMTLEGTILSYPKGSAARTTFVAVFLSDLAMALSVSTSRFIVTDVRAGSVVVVFSIVSTGSLADPSVNELLIVLDEQMEDESSPLRNGNVTEAAKGISYTTSSVSNILTAAPSSDALGISVLEYQEKGLFGFAATTWYTTEASKSLILTIRRDHGDRGIMDVGYTTSDGSASGGTDFVATNDTVRFYHGETSKEISIAILDDTQREAHFEDFTVRLRLEGPINTGAALMTAATEATVFVYDYGDGVVLASTTFGASSPNSTAGWTITDNGGQECWVAPEGLAAKDAVVGADEYDDRCDFAATVPCDHDCAFGGGLATLFPTTGESPSVLRLNGSGYVATLSPLTDFPASALSLSCWVRAIFSTGGRGGGTLLSYSAPDADPREAELLLHDLDGLSLLVHGTFVAASDRYDGFQGGDLGGIKTGIRVARDLAWHHVALAWRSADGKVDAFLDGVRVFDGGPYKTGAALAAGGRLVVGQAQSGSCSSIDANTVGNSTTLECEILSGETGPGGLEADVQNIRLWSKFVTTDEVAQQIRCPFEGNSVQQVLHWDFTPSMMEGGIVEDASGTGVSTSGAPNHGVLSDRGSALIQATPSLNPAYPCGTIHSGIWRFSAPSAFTTALQGSKAYGGRLQFRLSCTGANGDIRSARGAVTIRSRIGEVSWTSMFSVAEASTGEWTYFSVILREDHGWLHEPLGTAVSSTEMKEVLSSAVQLLIRGDLRVFGKEGGGQEVVYLQDPQIFARP